MTVTISKTDLARNTRDIVEQVKRGAHITVRSYGEDQIVLLDAWDYRVLRALVTYATRDVAAGVHDLDVLDRTVHAYLDAEISLSKAAEVLEISRFDLMARFERLGVPLRQGPESIDDARDEVRAARQHRDAAS